MELVKADNFNAAFQNMSRLPLVRQAGLLIGLAASIALGIAVVLWSRTPSYGLLYSGLAEKDASQVVEALQRGGIEFKVDQATGAIMVPGAKVHDARLKLAAEGLPHSTGHGFEIMEEQQRFGTSQFMQQARYQRAMEGEMARTIMEIDAVKNARVHLALPRETLFVRDRKKPSASVLVDLYPGRQLQDGQVAAIVHLVAASVPNLEAEQVTVVDGRGRLLSAEDRARGAAGLTTRQFDYTRRIEQDLVARIERILAPVVGPEGIRAQVTADIDFTVVEQTRESYDPDNAAVRSEQRLEEQSRQGGAAGGVPGALSNEPPGPASAPEQASGEGARLSVEESPLRSRSQATVNYELDRTISHTRRPGGEIQRLSVAVVVDDRKTPAAGGGFERAPRSAEELERFTALVREAVGFNAERGDTVNVINAAFTDPPAVGPLPTTPLWKEPWVWDAGKQALAGLFVLLLVLGVLRPVMRTLSSFRPAPVRVSAGEPHAELAEDQLSLSGGRQARLPRPGGYEDNLTMARTAVNQDSKRVAQVVKGWMAEEL